MVEHSPDLAFAIQRHTRAYANMHDLLYGALIGLVAQGMSPTPKRRVALCFPHASCEELAHDVAFGRVEWTKGEVGDIREHIGGPIRPKKRPNAKAQLPVGLANLTK